MFKNLTGGLSELIKKIRKKNVITSDNIKEMLSEIRHSLLDADASVEVVDEFLANVERRSLGSDVSSHLNPGEMIVKIINDELKAVLGGDLKDINLRTSPPAVILLVGVQGSGKTTTAAKLANFIKKTLKKDVLLSSIDVYRPAAIEQLKILAGQSGLDFYENPAFTNPIELTKDIYDKARKGFKDVLIIDTAGRMDTDIALMDEIKEVSSIVRPVETLLVIDSMLGKRAAILANEFMKNVKITGSILTKVDSDARGGALLSVAFITKTSVKFLATGEKVDDFEKFHPDRVSGRILGMGDVLGLIDDIEKKMDVAEAKKLAEKLRTGKGFTMNDLRSQLKQVVDAGGMASILEKMPIPQMQALKNVDTTKPIKKNIAIIDSMTPMERRLPEIIDNSRKNRISKGSGTSIADINALLKQFKHISKLMKGGNMMQKFSNMLKMPLG